MDQERSVGCERLARDDPAGHQCTHGFVCGASMGRWSDGAERSAGAGGSQCVSRRADGGLAADIGNLEKVVKRRIDQKTWKRRVLPAQGSAAIGGANRNCGRIIIWKSPKKRRVS